MKAQPIDTSPGGRDAAVLLPRPETAVPVERAWVSLFSDRDLATLLWRAVSAQEALVDDSQTPGISGEPRAVLVARRNALLKLIARFAFELPVLRRRGVATTLEIANRILVDLELFVLAIALARRGWSEDEIDSALQAMR